MHTNPIHISTLLYIHTLILSLYSHPPTNKNKPFEEEEKSHLSPLKSSVCVHFGSLKLTMVGMEDLGLSLSLSSTNHQHHHNLNALQLNLMPTSSTFSQQHQKSSPWMNIDKNLEMYRGETRSFLRGIDVNRMPQKTVATRVVDNDEEEEEGGNSSPNSSLSSLSGKRSLRDVEGGEEENYEMERACCSRGISDEEDGGGGGGSDNPNSRNSNNKKLRLSRDQSALLEDSFKENNTLNPKQKVALAKQLNLRPRQVEVWFQNRRARTKLKQTEVDCEFLKRSCENLAQENRRLQKEVQELRALKMSPQFYMHMTPPTTLTMCPSCERVATSAPAPSMADRTRMSRA